MVGNCCLLWLKNEIHFLNLNSELCKYFIDIHSRRGSNTRLTMIKGYYQWRHWTLLKFVILIFMLYEYLRETEVDSRCEIAEDYQWTNLIKIQDWRVNISETFIQCKSNFGVWYFLYAHGTHMVKKNTKKEKKAPT